MILANRVLGNEKVYYVQDGANQYGPHSETDIAEMVGNGSLSPTALICKTGWKTWAVMPPAVAALAPAGQSVEDAATALARVARSEIYAPPRPSRSARKERSPFGIAFGVTMGILVALAIFGFTTGFIQGFFSAATASGVNMAEYNGVRNGMSYQEVRQIVGAEGEMFVSSDGEFGNQSVEGRAYRWRGRQGGEMRVGFLNDRVIAKSQDGLK